MDETIIKLINVSCKIGDHYLVRDINWQVKRGEQWVVYGMNGSGKTTLLSIIAGFQRFTNGEIEVFGECPSNENILTIRKKIGWVSLSYFEKHYSRESALNIVLSGKDGTLGLNYSPTLEELSRAKMLLSDFNLGSCMDRIFDMFSKGERQNILIARALFHRPEVLILDEPCTGLDVYNREYLFQTLDRLQDERGMTIIYVTHYIDEVLAFFEKVMLLKNGSIFSKGNIDEVFSKQAFEEFLGYPVVFSKDSEGRYQLAVDPSAISLRTDVY